MLNSLKIRGRITEKGKTIGLIAPKMGMTSYTLGQKILNKKPMSLDEAQHLAKELDITEDEFKEFFLN